MPPAIVMAGMAIVGGIMQQQAAKKEGKIEQRAAQQRAEILKGRAVSARQEAGQVRASSQRQAIEERRQGKLVGGRAQNILAASGGGVEDPGAIQLLADIDRNAELNAMTALYQGEEGGRGLDYSAQLSEAGVQQELRGGEISRAAGKRKGQRAFAGSILKAGSSMYGGFK